MARNQADPAPLRELFLGAHIIGLTADECTDRLYTLAGLVKAKSRDFPSWSEVAWNSGDIGGAPPGFRCLKVTVSGKNAAQCADRLYTLAALIRSGADDYPDWASVVWNHGGSGGP